MNKHGANIFASPEHNISQSFKVRKLRFTFPNISLRAQKLHDGLSIFLLPFEPVLAVTKLFFWISIKSVRSSQNKCSYQGQLLLITFICPSRIFVCFLQFLRGQDSNWTNIGVNVFLYILGCNATTLVGNEFQRWNYVPLILYRVGLCRLWTSF